MQLVNVCRTNIVARSRSAKNTKRLDLRVPADWLDRVEEAAERKSIPVSAYIRMVISERMDQDQVPYSHSQKSKRS